MSTLDPPTLYQIYHLGGKYPQIHAFKLTLENVFFLAILAFPILSTARGGRQSKQRDKLALLVHSHGLG